MHWDEKTYYYLNIKRQRKFLQLQKYPLNNFETYAIILMQFEGFQTSYIEIIQQNLRQKHTWRKKKDTRKSERRTNINKEKLRNQIQQETNPSAKIPILTTYGGTKNEKLTTYGGTKNKYLQLMAELKTKNLQL